MNKHNSIVALVTIWFTYRIAQRNLISNSQLQNTVTKYNETASFD